MDLEMRARRSLPPLVEGKTHGYLKLLVDEVIWSRRSPGEVRVFASWWGETDSAQFRPVDITKSDSRTESDISEVYAIRTNLNLFQEYIKNCETIELVVVSEKTNAIVGTSQVTDLLDIFGFTPCFKYFPILNDNGYRIGEIHVSVKLMHVARPSNMQFKSYKHQKKENVVFSPTDNCRKYYKEKCLRDEHEDSNRKLFIEQSDACKSILKGDRVARQEPLKKFNNQVTDKLVAQVVARAQRLRGAILKESCHDDPLALSDNSFNDGPQSYPSAEDEAKLYEYFVGKEMSSSDERKALNTLRSTSPTSSLIEFASKTVAGCKCDHLQAAANKVSSTSMKTLSTETSAREEYCDKPKESLLLSHVDCIRIFVESFSLSPAGYRRVKSTSLSRNEGRPLSVTYFVQYDITFGYIKPTSGRPIKENRPVRISSKREMDQVICFNHDGTYGLSAIKAHTDYPVKFKVLIRHLNQKSPVELGTGSLCMSDVIKSDHLSSTQRLAIVNKGIKVGELSVTVELGSDFIHFGKQYVEGITSTKENIPVLEMHSLPTMESNKIRHVTGTQSKTSSRVSSTSTKGVECLTTGNSNEMFAAKNMTERRKENVDDRRIEVKSQEDNNATKILLHGLIYIAEGRELPQLSTYLICRAFWREDKATSQICSNTRNPVYNFNQLVPLIHGTDLLDRIKDNYIIVEVYCRNNETDNLLGLVKLPVHQLYVAYRDPLVLPHLLLSKYPVISVDGWVPIVNPMTGQSYGQLLSLVALGTAEQIALLQMSRGLQNVSPTSYTISSHPENFAECANPSETARETSKQVDRREPEEIYPRNNNYAFRAVDTAERDYQFSNYKTQESQTDITTVAESNPEQLVLHNLVGRLAQVLATGKANTDQAAQTEEEEEGTGTSKEPQLCMNELNFNNMSDESDSGSVRNNFQLPTEMYRSVGVGAEYDEQLDQQQSVGYGNTDFGLATSQNPEKEQSDSERGDSTFRAVIEIECALHLPKVERTSESIEPSTYVSFQANKSDVLNRLSSHTVTNVYFHSCNPKWNWKCDTKLPTELLLNDEKRLILKVWRLFDPESSPQINLERDIVIGFSAIDLSVLMTGFPVVSGWFHIMDFTGKCNGQIKVSITPLENLSPFGKSISTLNTNRLAACNASQSSWSPVYSPEVHRIETESSNAQFPAPKEDKVPPGENIANNPVSNFTYGLEDVSMSFLSQSLKQTLTELDEITKRLESRLRDVTSSAFEEDFENEFDMNEPTSDNENTNNRHADPVYAQTCQSTSRAQQAPPTVGKFSQDMEIPEEKSDACSNKRETENYPSINSNRTANNGVPCRNFNPYLSSSSSNNYYPNQNQAEYSQRSEIILDNVADHPARGTRTHINHLLDKLSFQPPVQSFPAGGLPMKKNIMDLLKNLHQNNNNVQDHNRYNREVKLCTVPTQTDDQIGRDFQDSQIQTNDPVVNNYDSNMSEGSGISQTNTRISRVLREELVAEENSEISKCDELSTYLMASNVRHMDLENIFNPLLYQHLMPDVHASSSTVVSPEGEAVEQLDNRYVRTFNKDENLEESQERMPRAGFELEENAELFRMTPSGVSENVDGNIDLTVIRKPSYNDLMASNSTESTTTISPEQSTGKQTQLEASETYCETSSDTSVPALSRQAPDGGNPIEDIAKPLIPQSRDDSRDSSLSS